MTTWLLLGWGVVVVAVSVVTDMWGRRQEQRARDREWMDRMHP